MNQSHDENPSGAQVTANDAGKSLRDRAEQMQSDVNQAIALADIYVRRDYLNCLSGAELLPLESAAQPGDGLRLIRIYSILYAKDEKLSRKIMDIFSAVESYGESVALLLNGKRERVDVYLGVSSAREIAAAPAFKTMLSAIGGVLPGCGYRTLRSSQIREVLQDVFPDEEELHLSAVSAFPSERDEDAYEQVEKLDVLIDSMRHKPFSMLLLARCEPTDVVSSMRQGLENLYTKISPLQKQDISYSINESANVGSSYSKSISDSLSHSEGSSYGRMLTVGTSTSTQTTPDDSEGARRQSSVQLIGTAAALLLGVPNEQIIEKSILEKLFYGSSVGNMLSNLDRALQLGPQTEHISVTQGQSKSQAENEGAQVTDGQTHGTSDTSGVTEGSSSGTSESVQRSVVNKPIANLLEMLDAQIKRLESFRKDGAFSVAAYFVAGDRETAVSAASLYRSMTSAMRSPARRTPIHYWKPDQAAGIIRYLKAGRHPVFRFERAEALPQIEAAQTISLKDIPAYFSLPAKSVPGIVVSQYASFARDIVVRGALSYGEAQRRQVRVGYVSHMGREERQSPVNLDVDDLTKHLFVAGATGVGKSNFCYQLLDQLDEQGVRMLVIEPAKGEYARVLGGRKGFQVFGVDARTAPLLRVNPFAFPEGLPVVQHIERLLDIFNAAWPMYSAMPAILKEAVEHIYVQKGFDLTLGLRPERAEFPCFADLLEALPEIIRRSAYSEEVKGNYTGALVTRVRSLTNGLYGLMFSKDEIGDETLYDSNVIIDVSRVGSAETKALLMGVLVMRLTEHRMVSGRMNSPLRHVTLLEEAHHLLRRNSGSSAEGVNLRAASVEMISGAIAEMRTYGEGFIIADQSPSVMDLSVIRNTQTKVFFMLPEREDRQIAGDSLSLNEEQRQELARLVPGVAAVYQNGWTDAVLCRINYFDKEREMPFAYAPKPFCTDRRLLASQAVAVALKPSLPTGQVSSVDEARIDQLLAQDAGLLGEQGRRAMEALRDYRSGLKHCDALWTMTLLEAMLPLRRIVRAGIKVVDIEKRLQLTREEIRRYVSANEYEVRRMLVLGMREMKAENPRIMDEIARFYTYCIDHEVQRRTGGQRGE